MIYFDRVIEIMVLQDVGFYEGIRRCLLDVSTEIENVMLLKCRAMDLIQGMYNSNHIEFEDKRDLMNWLEVWL